MPMLGPSLLITALFGVLELWLLFRVADETSFLFTFLLTVFTFFLGLGLSRGAIARMAVASSSAMERGQAPSLASGLLQLFAGFLLMVPGVISTIVGALLMLPPFHKIAASFMEKQNLARFERFSTFGAQGFPGAGPYGGTGYANQARHEPQGSARSASAGNDGFRFDDEHPGARPDDGYVPPEPSRGGPVILEGEIIDDER